RAAFGGMDMRVLVAIDGTVGTSASRKRQGVGSRAGGHRKHRHLGLEQVGELPVQQGAVFVVAIGGCQPVIGGIERAQDLGCDGGHVVAAETERNGGWIVVHVGHSSRCYSIVSSWRRTRRWTSNSGAAVKRIRIAAAAEAEPAPSPPSRKWYIRTVIVDQRLV